MFSDGRGDERRLYYIGQDMQLKDMTDEQRTEWLTEQNDFWFNWTFQNKMVLTISKDLLIHSELTPQECVDQAQELVSAYYNTVLKFDKDKT